MIAVGLGLLAIAGACGQAGDAVPGPESRPTPLQPDGAVALPTVIRPTVAPTGPPANRNETLLDSILEQGDPTGLDSFRQLLRRDAIEPIYDPQFVQADQAGLLPDELVMGVEINGDSRAYPIRYLRWREMVNDEVGGIPILVTW